MAAIGGYAMTNTCILDDCPVQRTGAGCGYLWARTPCRHPAWRKKWGKATDTADRRAEARARIKSEQGFETAWAKMKQAEMGFAS